MLNLSLAKAKRLLLLGAHSDDIEIGCGGTVLSLTQRNPKLEIGWVIFSADRTRAREALTSAQLFLKDASRSKIEVKNFRTSFFPVQEESIKNFFETLKRSFKPDIVFTHYREDRHQDHRVLSDLTWNTFRDHLILEYEIPKYDGDLGIPNLFVPLDDSVCREKVQNVCRVFGSQKSKHWFSEETFFSLMRLRGVECASRYAEAFYCRKMTCS